MVKTEPAAGPSEAGHHLVGDQQHAVSRADLGDRRPVVVGRHDRAEGGADDRLGEERGHPTGARVADRGVELGGQRLPLAEGVCAGLACAVRVGRRDVPEPAQPRLVRLAERRTSARIERAEGVAVIAPVPRDEDVPVRFPSGQVVDARELEGRLDRF